MKIISQSRDIILDESVTEIRQEGQRINAYSVAHIIPLGSFLNGDIAYDVMCQIRDRLYTNEVFYVPDETGE